MFSFLFIYFLFFSFVMHTYFSHLKWRGRSLELTVTISQRFRYILRGKSGGFNLKLLLLFLISTMSFSFDTRIVVTCSKVIIVCIIIEFTEKVVSLGRNSW